MRHLGKIIAESLGVSNAIVWDTYLFYDKGSEWKERAPTPLDWAHQLDDPWADPSHFAWGDYIGWDAKGRYLLRIIDGREWVYSTKTRTIDPKGK